jgi:hypothetical protein
VTIVAVGTCTIRASQAGNANYAAAPNIDQGFTVAQGSQTITFAPSTPVSLTTAAPPFTLSATATSGLTVTFVSTTPGICATSGANGATVTISGALGTCTIQASVAANANYLAGTASRSIPIGTAQTPSSITLSASTANPSYGQPFTLNASIVGNNPTGTATFTVLGTSGNIVICENVPLNAAAASCVVPRSLRNAGANLYSVNYSGNTNNTSASASLNLTINQAKPVLSLAVSPVKPIAGQTLTLTALIGADDLTGQISFFASGAVISGCDSLPLRILPASTGAEPDAAVATCAIPNVSAGNLAILAGYSPQPVLNSAGILTSNNQQVQASLAVVVGAANSGPINDFSNMWWAGPAENGWGMSIAQKGGIQFNAFYIYDAQGKPQWLVMPGGQWNSTGAPFTRYTGLLYQPTGAPFTNYDTTQFKPGTSVGSATITYLDANNAQLSVTVNGVTTTKTITRQALNGSGAPDTQPRLIVNDLWWAGIGENGWGINIAQQARTLFMVWYTYGQDGKTMWFTVPGGTWNGTIFTGDIYSTTSSAWIGVPYDASQFKATKVGTMVIDFEDANKAVMTSTVNGQTQTRIIVRQPF